MSAPHKTQNRIVIWSSNSTSRHMPQRIGSKVPDIFTFIFLTALVIKDKQVTGIPIPIGKIRLNKMHWLPGLEKSTKWELSKWHQFQFRKMKRLDSTRNRTALGVPRTRWMYVTLPIVDLQTVKVLELILFVFYHKYAFQIPVSLKRNRLNKDNSPGIESKSSTLSSWEELGLSLGS